MGVIRNTSGTFEFTWPNLPLFVPAEGRQVIATIQHETVGAALSILASRVSEEAPKNFGHLAQSFSAMPATDIGGMEIVNRGSSATTGLLEGRVFSSLPQAVVMEEGRRAGAPISRAGIAAIGLWVRRKLGLSGKEAESAMWAVATSIKQKGIAGKFYARAAFTKAQPEIRSLFDETAKGIMDGLTTPKGGA